VIVGKNPERRAAQPRAIDEHADEQGAGQRGQPRGVIAEWTVTIVLLLFGTLSWRGFRIACDQPQYGAGIGWLGIRDTRPIADAPSRIAVSASSTEAMQQILTAVFMLVLKLLSWR